MKLSTYHNIYFIGIGGIGMSALAKYFLAENKKVSGYDKTPSDNTKTLEDLGVNISYSDDIDTLNTLGANLKSKSKDSPIDGRAAPSTCLSPHSNY